MSIYGKFDKAVSKALGINVEDWTDLPASAGMKLDPQISDEWNPVQAIVNLQVGDIKVKHLAVMHRFVGYFGKEGEPVLRLFTDGAEIGPPVPLERAEPVVETYKKTGHYRP